MIENFLKYTEQDCKDAASIDTNGIWDNNSVVNDFLSPTGCYIIKNKNNKDNKYYYNKKI